MKISDMLEDSLIHIPNIIELLINRNLMNRESSNEFQ